MPFKEAAQDNLPPPFAPLPLASSMYSPPEYISICRSPFASDHTHTQLSAALQYMHICVAEAKPSPPCLLCSTSQALEAYRQSISPSGDFSLDSSQYTLLSLRLTSPVLVCPEPVLSQLGE